MAGYYNPYLYPYYNPYNVQNVPVNTQTQQTYQNTVTNQNATQSNINWVQGESGAKSYPVAPNNTVQLMDSEQARFYWKTADQNGMPQQLRIFEYKEITPNSPINEKSEKAYKDIPYATKDDIEEIRGQIEQIKRDMDIKPKNPPKKEVKKQDDEE